METEREISATIAGVILRLRSERIRLQVEMARIDGAIEMLAAKDPQEIKQLPAGVVIDAEPMEDLKPRKRRRGSTRKGTGQLSKAVRMAVSKIGPAKLGEILKFVVKMGLDIASGQVSTALSYGKTKGEFKRTPEGLWSYTGGVISREGMERRK